MDIVAGVAIADVSGLAACYDWLQWAPDRNGIAGVALALVILMGVFAVVVTHFPDFSARGKYRCWCGLGVNCSAQR